MLLIQGGCRDIYSGKIFHTNALERWGGNREETSGLHRSLRRKTRETEVDVHYWLFNLRVPGILFISKSIFVLKRRVLSNSSLPHEAAETCHFEDTWPSAWSNCFLFRTRAHTSCRHSCPECPLLCRSSWYVAMIPMQLGLAHCVLGRNGAEEGS